MKKFNTIKIWFKRSMDFIKALPISVKNLASTFIRGNASRVKEWFRKNKHILAMLIPVIAIVYFIPYTFMLGNRERTIIGIILQILAGVILVFNQIASNPRIRKQVTKIIQKPLLFALLITIILLPFAIAVLTSLGDIPSNRWSAAWGITFFTSITFGMFLSSLMLLRRIKWLRRKDYVPIAKDKFDISDLSLRNVGILLGASLLIMILLSYLLYWLYPHKELWIQILLLFLLLSYTFTLFPLLIISPLYLLAFGFARLTLYIHTKRNIGILFWIFLFILWSWGGLLLIIKEFI